MCASEWRSNRAGRGRTTEDLSALCKQCGDIVVRLMEIELIRKMAGSAFRPDPLASSKYQQG